MNLMINLLAAILLPIAAGLFLLVMSGKIKNRTLKCAGILLVMLAASALSVRLMLAGDYEFDLWQLTNTLAIRVRMDNLTRLFLGMTVAAWTLGGLFAFEYMKHEENEDRYFGFYLIVMGVLVALDHAGNLITLYLFFEMMTLTSLPLVLRIEPPSASTSSGDSCVTVFSCSQACASIRCSSRDTSYRASAPCSRSAFIRSGCTPAVHSAFGCSRFGCSRPGCSPPSARAPALRSWGASPALRTCSDGPASATAPAASCSGAKQIDSVRFIGCSVFSAPLQRKCRNEPGRRCPPPRLLRRYLISRSGCSAR